LPKDEGFQLSPEGTLSHLGICLDSVGFLDIFSLTYIQFFDYLTQLIMTFSHILTLVCSPEASRSFPTVEKEGGNP
jgi:hypothetical protein